ncbi:MAG: hypothetical protein AB8B58_11765 [Roseobacter sp.]
MPTNREWAAKILEQFVLGASEGRIVWTYGDMATAIGRPGEHRLLGGPLDELRKYCQDLELPDLATVVVSKESLIDGRIEPSKQAFDKYDGWPQLRREQAKVFNFDWSTVELS